MLKIQMNYLVWTAALAFSFPVILAGGLFFSLLVATLFPILGILYIIYTEKTIDTIYMAGAATDLQNSKLLYLESLNKAIQDDKEEHKNHIETSKVG